MASVEKFFLEALSSCGIHADADIAVAVSGGGDSMALALLLKKFCTGRLLALTVDHGLRAESKAEAAQVHEILAARGIDHKILTWMGEKPSSRIQERARDARYELLLDACGAENIKTLAVAHNAEDLIETFWMRLAHGSGLDGLAGMAAKRNTGGIDIIRPLMSCTREELRGYCRDNKVNWIEDPSNVNPKYLRVKLRQFEDVLSQEGLTPDRLSATVQKLGEAREALQFFASDIFSKTVTVHAEGYLSLDREALNKFPADIRRRVIEKSLSVFSHGGYPTPFDALDALHREIFTENFTGRTLGGCEIFPSDKKILFCREEVATEPRRKAADGIIWDGRFALSSIGEDFEVGKLGEEGVSMLRKQSTENANFETLPFKIKKTLPALWQGENIVGVPILNWYSLEASAVAKSAQIRFKIV